MSNLLPVMLKTHLMTCQTSSALLGHSLHEILKHLLEQKKQAKLSLLAKEVGFQLLSNDIDIRITGDCHVN